MEYDKLPMLVDKNLLKEASSAFGKIGIESNIVEFLLCCNLLYKTKEGKFAFRIIDNNYEQIGTEYLFKESNKNMSIGVNITGTYEPENVFYFQKAIDITVFIQKMGLDKFSEIMSKNVYVSMDGLNINILQSVNKKCNPKNIYLCVYNPEYSQETKEFLNKLKNKCKYKLLYPKNYKSWYDTLNKKASIRELMCKRKLVKNKIGKNKSNVESRSI